MNNKRFVALGIVFLLLLAIVYTPKILGGDDKNIKYKLMENTDVPDKLNDIISSYLQEERALACRVENQVYIVVTRGEMETGGYSINIRDISKVEESEEGFNLLVEAEFIDPGEDDLIIKNSTYPYIVLETNLKQMPKKVELKVEN